MRTYIHLVRHGESLSNLNPLFEGENILSEKGVTQAQSVADRFKREKIDIIYHSGILRAQKTAEEIAQPTKVNVEVLSFLEDMLKTFVVQK